MNVMYNLFDHLSFSHDTYILIYVNLFCQFCRFTDKLICVASIGRSVAFTTKPHSVHLIYIVILVGHLHAA